VNVDLHLGIGANTRGLAAGAARPWIYAVEIASIGVVMPGQTTLTIWKWKDAEYERWLVAWEMAAVQKNRLTS